MVYNYSVKPCESFNIKTPGNHSFDDITKHIKSDSKITINNSIYPNGFEVRVTQVETFKIIITSNMELVKHDDGYYYIKEN